METMLTRPSLLDNYGDDKMRALKSKCRIMELAKVLFRDRKLSRVPVLKQTRGSSKCNRRLETRLIATVTRE